MSELAARAACRQATGSADCVGSSSLALPCRSRHIRRGESQPDWTKKMYEKTYQSGLPPNSLTDQQLQAINWSLIHATHIQMAARHWRGSAPPLSGQHLALGHVRLSGPLLIMLTSPKLVAADRAEILPWRMALSKKPYVPWRQCPSQLLAFLQFQVMPACNVMASDHASPNLPKLRFHC